MAADADLVTLHAEILAVQAVLIALARRLAKAQPELGATLCAAFDDAETLMSGVAVRLAADLPTEATIESLRIIDEMRAAVIQDESLCGPADPGNRGR
jgi:hypothetical protein